MDVLRRTIAGYARHPNFAGILILGLGCESNQISGLMRAEGLKPSQFLHTMTIQETGGTAKTVREGVQRMKVGEKTKLVCPSEIAYGDRGTPDGSIPPGATLVFEVELLGIKGK